MRAITLRGLALALVLVTVLPTSARAGEADEGPVLVRFVVSRAEPGATGLYALLVAAYSKRPGVALLEGARTAEIEAEHALSESGVVAEDSRVRDRRLSAEATVTLHVAPGSRSPKLQVRAEVVGVGGSTALSLELDPTDEEALWRTFDPAIARVLPAPRDARFRGRCTDGTWSGESLDAAGCVREIGAACAGVTPPKEQLVCLGRHGAEVRRRHKALKEAPDAVVFTSPEERAKMLALREKGGRDLTEAETAAFQRAMERSLAWQKQRKESLAAFMEGFAADMNERMEGLSLPLSVRGGSGGDFELEKFWVEGVQWQGHQSSPNFLARVTFRAPDRHIQKESFGTVRRFVERLQSFGLKGHMVGGEEVFDYRLLTHEEHRSKGWLMTSLPTEYFAQAAFVSPYEPKYRATPE